MEALDKFRFTKQIFPQLNIQKPYPNVKDYILFLATIFRKNDVTKLPKILNKLKYSSKESNNITFLVYLNNFNPKNIYNVKKAQEKTTLTPKQIQEYGKLIGKDFKKWMWNNMKIRLNLKDISYEGLEWEKRDVSFSPEVEEMVKEYYQVDYKTFDYQK